ncbi:MAG: hypothetical protein BroJett018_34070 [Chloroflexota bacterium]|nr:hypothetical protein [Chloroflexota bacterium]NOG64083.1 hypothetical protein [Chloroflexota bacterium]GIK65613.1 MAG: hypothetical protein BroJett018_34070 [Chloroflexota bacterium]
MDIVFRLLIGGIFIFGGIWILFFIRAKRFKVKILNEGDSRETKATITRAGWERVGNNRVYRTYYSYTVEGAIFDSDIYGNWSRRAPDGVLPIRYLANNPGIHEVMGTSDMLGPETVLTILFGLAFIVVGIAFILFVPF